MIETNKNRNTLTTIILVISTTIIVFILIRILLKPIIIDDKSMSPLLSKGNMAFFFKFPTLNYGKIVLFKDNRFGYHIGRIVARTGDTVEIINKNIYINGNALENSWKIKKEDKRIFSERFSNRDNQKIINIQPGYIFLLNDNWDYPFDSRFFGPIPIESIVGQYMFKISLK